MLYPILSALGFWVMSTFVAASIRYLRSDLSSAEKLSSALGARDVLPPLTQHGERADRARANLAEALPVFLGLALLCEIQGIDSMAVNGAWIWLAMRVLYLPAYIFGVFGLRSTFWTLSWIGLSMMAGSLITA